MAHSEIPAEKIEAYLKTEYRFGEGLAAVTLCIDRRSEELARLYASSGTVCGVFVTAFNPFGRVQTIEDNEAAHEHLGTELRALSARVIEGAGTDSSGAWPEEKSLFFCPRGRSRCREKPRYPLQAGCHCVGRGRRCAETDIAAMT
ncbi:MAG: DUF3293 domain-containing protein [Burkholderiales bacterium]|nr:DUF3293 domain-containing protein [Burkholderiales bacterium]